MSRMSPVQEVGSLPLVPHGKLVLYLPIFVYFRFITVSMEKKNKNKKTPPIPWKTVKGLEEFFIQKDKFWEDGIMKLPEKWQKIVE